MAPVRFGSRAAITARVVCGLITVLGGFLAGILQPAIRDAYGADLTGVLVLSPLALAVPIFDPPRRGWRLADAIAFAASTFFTGSLFGAAVWFGRDRWLARWEE